LLLIAGIAIVAVLGAVGWSVLPDASAGDLSEILEGVLRGPSDKAQREPPGPEEISVPDVEGLTERAARERLAEAGFETESRRRGSSEEDSGRVLEQSVSDGEKVDKDSKILLTVGEGQQDDRTPDLVGLSYDKAESELEESGFLLGGVKEESSDAAPAGVIIEQDPPPGTELDPGSYVYLTTSVGPSEENGTSADQGP
jgi:eukaryotic-like serine/threonine-protein kinase